MSNQRGTDLPEFINDLDGGVFAEKVSHALSDVAAGVIETDKNGEVTLKFKLGSRRLCRAGRRRRRGRVAHGDSGNGSRGVP